jgi:N-methylhydantoinase A/oxoprolinase/acetone carboxylase beta subunit
VALRIGIDVGGTHTDAVILDSQNSIVGAEKVDTTEDVSTGISDALDLILRRSGVDRKEITAAMFGTTHCTNAIVERKRLAHVGLIRIGKPATVGIPPLYSLPVDLRRAIGDTWAIVPGGHEFDGKELSRFDEEATTEAAERFRSDGVEAVAISSVFSPVNSAHEVKAGQLVSGVFGRGVPITLSHEIGSIGLLERENASALNCALTKVANAAITGFQESMRKAGITSAKIFLTQNDGTLMTVDYARKFPIRTIASGPTNSMRGAAFLTGLRDGIVVDIGGTTMLVGALVHGFPRESGVAVEIGGARTNFRMPDLVAVSCGGGTVVTVGGEGSPKVGPESVGFRITKDSCAWGGRALTTTDIALGLGYAKIDDPNCEPERVRDAFSKGDMSKAMELILSIFEDSIDKMKASADPVPVVLVGGGGIIIPSAFHGKIGGVSKIIRPSHFQFANAIGATISQVSGEIDGIYDLDKIARADAVAKAKEAAVAEAVRAGADPSTVETVETEEIPLSYLPGTAIRIRAKAAGGLLYGPAG